MISGSNMPHTDLRSDTVTQPTTAMRKAMMDAPLGDDVLGDDPTVKRLEAMAAERTGKEAALFTPSGTMANLLAIRVSTQIGDEVLMYAGAHPFNYEAAGAAAFAGVQIRTLEATDGIISAETLQGAFRPEDDHYAPAQLLSLEDTANRGGGTVHTLDQLDTLTRMAHKQGLRTHLDGARVFNAVVQSGVSLARRAKGFDTVQFCFSKGLGAPVGSVLCGTTEAIRVARRMRKALGGGMRQSGILAAAAVYALEHHVERLVEDHHHAHRLCEGLTAAGFTVKLPHTNMVYVTVDDAPAWQDRLAEAGVLCFSVSPTELRLVTHLDVDEARIEHAITTFDRMRTAPALPGDALLHNDL
jgi:threonine aldolase